MFYLYIFEKKFTISLFGDKKFSQATVVFFFFLVAKILLYAIPLSRLKKKT